MCKTKSLTTRFFSLALILAAAFILAPKTTFANFTNTEYVTLNGCQIEAGNACTQDMREKFCGGNLIDKEVPIQRYQNLLKSSAELCGKMNGKFQHELSLNSENSGYKCTNPETDSPFFICQWTKVDNGD